MSFIPAWSPSDYSWFRRQYLIPGLRINVNFLFSFDILQTTGTFRDFDQPSDKEHCQMFRISFSGEDETSKKLHLKGSYKLFVSHNSLCLCKPKGNKTVYEWMYACIRGYGKTENAFMFECGRSSVSGEGVFHLKTKEGGAIYDAVHQRVTKLKDAEGCVPGQRDGGPSATVDSTCYEPYHLNPRHQPSIRRENVYEMCENARRALL